MTAEAARRSSGAGTRRAHPPRLLLTCEHGGHRVPRELAHLFRGQQALLASHRGWDPGALALARHLGARLRAPLIAATVSRLVVDLNRSPGHPRVFSESTRALAPAERARLLARHHRPHRRAVEARARRLASRGCWVLHVAVHSFTPVLGGRTRDVDVGLLFDPRRSAERDLCLRWRRALRSLRPDLRVAFNRPYRGTSDGLTTTLRGRLEPSRYLGIELEVNQARLSGTFHNWKALAVALAESLAEVQESPVPRRRPQA